MRAGKLDRRIVIEQNAPTYDGGGGEIDSWSTLAIVWAEIRPMSGSERFQGQQVLAQADYRFLIRYRTDVTPKMRITYDGKIYDITEVSEIGRKQGTQIFAKINVA